MTAALTSDAPGSARTSGRLGFRTDIEGLRGVSVLLVLLYHATFPWIEGGYVGVDVFFVISGYLITRLLVAEFENGTFSARNFYIRRIRRLIPALLATILATILAGVVILSPQHLEELGTSSIFAALSLSNVHFAFAGGYFETSSKIKPLLHTWSLSVEEQFYLLWPLTLWAIFAVGILRKHLFWIIGLALVLGLVVSEYWISRNPTHAYFLSPFRAYQLLAGALAVWAERRFAGLGPVMATVIAGTGLAIVVATALLYTEATPFPGLWGALPVLGGFLVVAAGAGAPFVTTLLSVQPLTWLGQISYSVYLAHWPIVVYARYLSPDPFSTMEQCALLAASILGGLILFHAVEAKFRVSGAGAGAGHRWRQTAGVGVVCACTVAISAWLQSTGGLPQRMDRVPEKIAYAEAMSFDFLARYRNGIRQEGTGENGYRVLIVGDSMMQNYIPALLRLPEIAAAEVTLATRGGCPLGRTALHVVNGGTDRHCRALRDRIYADTSHYDLVIWGQSWLEYQDRLYLELAGTRMKATGEGIARWRTVIRE
ncbi:MAG: acyltransferase family protein, partial [Pseudomonadota bacterium]